MYIVVVEWWYNNGSCIVVCNVIYFSSEMEDIKYYLINKFYVDIYMLMILKKKILVKIFICKYIFSRNKIL